MVFILYECGYYCGVHQLTELKQKKKNKVLKEIIIELLLRQKIKNTLYTFM